LLNNLHKLLKVLLLLKQY